LESRVIHIFLKFIGLSSLAASLTLSGCATIDVPVQPIRPATTLTPETAPATFFNSDAETLPLSFEWWQSFEDPTLNQLIAQALTTNRQLSVADANIKIAKASLSRQTLQKTYNIDSNINSNIGRAARANEDITGTLSGRLSANWEFDAFGRIATAIKATELNLEAVEQARRDVAVIVASETALAYNDLRGAQQRLTVAQKNARIQAQSLELVQALLENGRATELDFSRAEAQYRTTLANQPTLQAIIDGAISRLAVLTGHSASEPENALLNLKTGQTSIPMVRQDIALGSPQDLIRRRPDIRAAEIEITRRLALSEVDRARLFPTITFNADLFTLFGFGNRFDQQSGLGFGIGPAINWAGPDLRRVRADIDISDAETLRAYQQYEQTVLQALADVETALSNSRNEKLRQRDLVLAANAAERARELAQLRFEEGLDDFLDVLDAQRTILEAEDRLAQNQLQTTRLAILTYRELGGIN